MNIEGGRIFIPNEHKATNFNCEPSRDIVSGKMHNMKEIEVFKMVGKWKKDPNCKECVIDDSPGYWNDAMPIWRTDSLDDILKRYWKVFKWEAVGLQMQMKEVSKMQDDRGFSKDRRMKYMGSIPETLAMILKKHFPKYLKTKKGMYHLKERIPVLFV